MSQPSRAEQSMPDPVNTAELHQQTVDLTAYFEAANGRPGRLFVVAALARRGRLRQQRWEDGADASGTSFDPDQTQEL